MTKWAKLWIAWAILAVGGFFVIELPAVFNDERGDTLTEHVVTYIPLEVGVAIFGLLFAALPIWLWVHFRLRYAKKPKGNDDA